MMSLQARESSRPYIGTGHSLRVYAIDSPRAKARLVVLALLADGRLDEREKLLQLITAVISSDGRLSEAEESLFLAALDAWKPPRAQLPRAALPELHYG